MFKLLKSLLDGLIVAVSYRQTMAKKWSGVLWLMFYRLYNFMTSQQSFRKERGKRGGSSKSKINTFPFSTFVLTFIWMTALPRPTLAHHTQTDQLGATATAHLLPNPSDEPTESSQEYTWVCSSLRLFGSLFGVFWSITSLLWFTLITLTV